MAFTPVPYWKKIPALRLLLPVMGGICLQWYLPVPTALAWAGMATPVIILFIFRFAGDYHKFRLAHFSGFLFFLFFTCLGITITRLNDIRQHPRWLGHFPGEGIFQVRILESPLPREKTWKATGELLLKTTTNKKPQLLRGKLILYFPKTDMTDSMAAAIRPGSLLLLRQPPQPIPPPSNPGQFNFQRYCLFNGITHQAFLRDTSYLLITRTRPAPFRKWLEDVRNSIVGTLKRYIADPKAAGLAEALLIGYKNDLDKDLLQTYSDTGVVHIIAISGLHLGIIYWILRWLTRTLPQKGRGRWWRFLLILGSMWLFSLLAGAQPSVLRSAVMFSFILVAETIHRRSNIYNTLCCSAFFLLLVNPFWLWDLGFQLSYAAVLSLILYMQPVYRSWYIPQKWLDSIWQMCAVTLAAQVLTIPLCLYHFHQFPTYFLPANLVCVPLSSALLIGAILLVAISPVIVLAQWLGLLLQEGIRLMNFLVEWIVKLPGSTIRGFSLHELQMATCYLLLICFMAFICWKNKTAVKGFLFSIILVMIIGYWQRQQHNSRAEWRVYHLGGYSSSDFIEGRRYLTIGEDTTGMDAGSYRFQLMGARSGLTRLADSSIICTSSSTICAGNKKILILDRPLRKPLPVNADVLWLKKGSRLLSQKIAIAGKVNQIVADGSLPAWHTRVWKETAAKEGIAFHDVKTDGFFALRLR